MRNQSDSRTTDARSKRKSFHGNASQGALMPITFLRVLESSGRKHFRCRASSPRRVPSFPFYAVKVQINARHDVVFIRRSTRDRKRILAIRITEQREDTVRVKQNWRLRRRAKHFILSHDAVFRTQGDGNSSILSSTDYFSSEMVLASEPRHPVFVLVTPLFSDYQYYF